jgi:hypothetical protein
MQSFLRIEVSEVSEKKTEKKEKIIKEKKNEVRLPFLWQLLIKPKSSFPLLEID